MTALRERQKAARRLRIAKAAASLIREVGYERATMEAIAERASVSKGTVYNYYENKGDVLLAIITMEAKETYEIGRSVIEDEAKSPCLALLELIQIYIDEPMKIMGKEGWRHAISMAILQPTSTFGSQHADVDRRLGLQMTELIQKMKSRGFFERVTNPTTLGQVLFNNVNMMFTLFVCSDSINQVQLLENLRHQTLYILEAFGEVQ